MQKLGWLDHDISLVNVLARVAIRHAASGGFDGPSLAAMTRALNQAKHADKNVRSILYDPYSSSHNKMVLIDFLSRPIKPCLQLQDP